MIIKGNSVGCVRSNWNQTDPKEPDYIIGKELVENAIQEANDNSNSKPDIKVVSVTLASGNWSNKQQQVTVNGVLSDTDKCHIIPGPNPASHAVYYDCDVRATAQAANKVTFTCEEVPTSNLTVNVAIILQGVTS